jgi:hypothetical protein
MPDSIGTPDDDLYLEKLKKVLEIQKKLVSAIKEVLPYEKQSPFFSIQSEINDLLGECSK